MEHPMTIPIPSLDTPLQCILLFGPPGSGKGTVGRMLAQAGNHYHLSSGDIFRGLSATSPAGQLFATYASKGHLVPDDVTIAIWHQYVIGLIATNRYFPSEQFLLLDGVPRTPAQAKLLDAYIHVAHVIVLDIPNVHSLIQRMKKRALIEKRPDDADESVLRTRMEVYEKQTAQVLSHYPVDKISHFNADQRPTAVLRDVLIKLCPIL